MSEHNTYSCDVCGTTVIAKQLPGTWDWVHIKAMRTNFSQSMHVCGTCLGGMRESRARVLIERLIALVALARKRRLAAKATSLITDGSPEYSG